MQIKTSTNSHGRTVEIQTDKQLDAKIHSVVSQAVILASSPWVDNIEIDLRKTRVIRDSGLALLSMLCKKSGLSSKHIKVVNCWPEIRTQLLKSELSTYLQLA